MEGNTTARRNLLMRKHYKDKSIVATSGMREWKRLFNIEVEMPVHIIVQGRNIGEIAEGHEPLTAIIGSGPGHSSK